jgi:hypothetical protein
MLHLRQKILHQTNTLSFLSYSSPLNEFRELTYLVVSNKKDILKKCIHLPKFISDQRTVTPIE